MQQFKTIKGKAERNARLTGRAGMLEIFKRNGLSNSRNSEYQFWRQDNQPKECYSKTFTDQKLDYIHNNPIEEGIVDKAEEYLYSNARDYYIRKKIGLLELNLLMNKILSYKLRIAEIFIVVCHF